jgi:hypothetical protein
VRLPRVVDVYRNLNRACWSVRDSSTRRVVAHVNTIALTACTMHVSNAGRRRVLREHRRNVHAFIRGAPTLATRPQTRIRYDPFTMPGFELARGGRTVERASVVVFDANGHAWARVVD